jgi:hypothetical protein
VGRLRPPMLDELLSHEGNIGCCIGEVEGDAGALDVSDSDARAPGLSALAVWAPELRGGGAG